MYAYNINVISVGLLNEMGVTLISCKLMSIKCTRLQAHSIQHPADEQSAHRWLYEWSESIECRGRFEVSNGVE